MATVQMIPPSDGSRNSMTVAGRTYSALPQMAIPVQHFDVSELQANGWQQLPVSAVSGMSEETLATKLRRLRSSARNNNPLESPPLAGSKPWMVLTGAWAGNTAVTVGHLYSNGGLAYLCVSSGTTAATGGPTGTSSIQQTDGTAAWIYWCGTAGDILGNGGQLYQIVTAGLPAATGTGPSGFGAAITDGTIVWAHIGPATAPSVSVPSATHNAAFTQSVMISNYTVDGGNPFRLRGGTPYNIAGFGASTFLVESIDTSPAAGNLGTGGDSCWYIGIEFEFEGRALELQYFSGNNSMPIDIIVDGRYLDRQPAIYGTNGTWFQTIDFTNVNAQSGASFQSGEQKHRILLELPALNFIVTQINLPPTAQISYPETPDNFSVVTLGDSVANTNYANAPNNNGGLIGVYPLLLSKLLGLPDMVPCAMGGTGWVNPGAGQPFIYRIERLQAVNAYRPLKYIFVQTSFNDYNYLAQLPAAANALLTSLRANFPTAMIIVEGPHSGGGTPLTTSQAIEEAVQPAVTQLQREGDGLLFYLPSQLASLGVVQPWIFGTGNISAPANDGNADTCIGGDGVHPSGDGSLQRARRIMNTLFQVLAKVG